MSTLNRPGGLVDERGPERGPQIVQPMLGPAGWLRFIWRQLTSMRTALLLLMLLAVGAIPGSVFPQNRIDPARVESYLNDHPGTGPWLQWIGAFDVYSSVWFSAVYLLLFVSLVGCVLPRTGQHWRALRSAPPRAPRRLDRMPAFAGAASAASPDEVLNAARAVLRRRRYRLAVVRPGDDAVAAERGHLAESGNLAFHLALLGVLCAVAAGSFLAYSGQVVVVTGNSWSNQLLQYDSFTPGRAVNTDELPGFSLSLDSMTVKFDAKASGNQFGAPREFEAKVSYQHELGGRTGRKTIRVNDPLKVDGVSVFLVGNGYAPVITVRDPGGTVVYSGPTPFQPVDSNYTSSGVVKVPDGLSTQLGLVGQLLPTAAFTASGQPVSVFPDDENPLLIFTGFTGDLGIDSGVPQSVYALDASKLTQISLDGEKFSSALKLGERAELPNGLGSVIFEGIRRYAALDVRHDPTKIWVLICAATALAGLTTSLFVRRRRIWVRATTGRDGRTVVQVAGLARSEDAGLLAEVQSVLAAVPHEED